MAKIENDKYYTPVDLAKYCIDKTFEIIGKENIVEIIEPSAGNGSFSNQLDCIAYDLHPEGEGIIKQDYLKLDLPYKKGRLIIGNPPFGDRSNLFRKFYNKSVELGDYISFISPIKMLNNTRQNYKFNLIHSEDLNLREYSGVELHCCLNIYKRPKNGLNKKSNIKLKDISIYREDEKIYQSIIEDFKICRMGAKTWKILDSGQELRNFKVVVNNIKLKDRIVEVLNEKYIKYLQVGEKVISTPYIAKDDIYIYLKEQILEIQ